MTSLPLYTTARETSVASVALQQAALHIRSLRNRDVTACVLPAVCRRLPCFAGWARNHAKLSIMSWDGARGCRWLAAAAEALRFVKCVAPPSDWKKAFVFQAGSARNVT
jgi:hypothetical protein